MNKKMKVTKHAESRIVRGDKKGLRTVLSTAQVLEAIQSPEAVKVDGEIYFWSEADDCCLTAITALRNTVLITVYPADRDLSPWMGMISKYRTVKKPVFIPVETKSNNPYHAVGISMVEYNNKKGVHNKSNLHCVWFDFEKCDSVMFWEKDFHEMLMDFATHYIEERSLSPNKLKKLRFQIRGNGWTCYCPLDIPFELLNLASPYE